MRLVKKIKFRVSKSHKLVRNFKSLKKIFKSTIIPSALLRHILYKQFSNQYSNVRNNKEILFLIKMRNNFGAIPASVLSFCGLCLPLEAFLFR